MLSNLCTLAFALGSMAAFAFGGPAVGIGGAVWLGLGTALSGFLGGVAGGIIGGGIGLLFGEEGFFHLGVAIGCVGFAISTSIDDIKEKRQKTPTPTVKVSQRLIENKTVDLSTIPSVKKSFSQESQHVEYDSIEEMIEANRSPYSAPDNDNNKAKGSFKSSIQPKKDTVATKPVTTTPKEKTVYQVIKNSDTANSNTPDAPQNLTIPLSRATP